MLLIPRTLPVSMIEWKSSDSSVLSIVGAMSIPSSLPLLLMSFGTTNAFSGEDEGPVLRYPLKENT